MNDYFALSLPDGEIQKISTIALAHEGDAVYELMVRSFLCLHGKATGKGMHRAAVELVRAPKQAELCEFILPLLNEEETAVFKRGRNANVHTIAHNATHAEYQKATALEALFGYLYLKGEKERLNTLFDAMMEGNHAS